MGVRNFVVTFFKPSVPVVIYIRKLNANDKLTSMQFYSEKEGTVGLFFGFLHLFVSNNLASFSQSLPLISLSTEYLPRRVKSSQLYFTAFPQLK